MAAKLRRVVRPKDLHQQIIETTSEHDGHGQHQHTRAWRKIVYGRELQAGSIGGHDAGDAPCTQ
jgi:hypothetical protein